MFQQMDFQHGKLTCLGKTQHPGSVWAWDRGHLDLSGEDTAYGYVYEGRLDLECASGIFTLNRGMYFCLPGRGRLQGQGRGLLIFRENCRGLFQIGGPVENQGRLEYIDGCSDTLLIAPVRLGDPCLNLLVIPENTQQSQHTHPSYRVGIIASGTGECVTPEGRIPLHPGIPFMIPAGARHSFHTGPEDLHVIAYHPDSDFGPTDDNHPMINKTILQMTHSQESQRLA